MKKFRLIYTNREGAVPRDVIREALQFIREQANLKSKISKQTASKLRTRKTGLKDALT
jgi:hypothetical protein